MQVTLDSRAYAQASVSGVLQIVGLASKVAVSISVLIRVLCEVVIKTAATYSPPPNNITPR